MAKVAGNNTESVLSRKIWRKDSSERRLFLLVDRPNKNRDHLDIDTIV